ncbi:PIN domain-containing protein [Nostoc sp. CCY 9925]|uniref:PIN domain-containing protein n=1 Tax=Nostoc sp. CCY 9925 TaxID=3103865 RepID=UPI0039C69C73
MDIVIDANVIIADPWFRSQRMRVLLDFAEKRFSQVLLLEPVEMEVRAHFKREVTARGNSIEAAIKNAERIGIRDTPEFDAKEVFKCTFTAWEENLEKLVRSRRLFRIPLEASVLHEAMQRATERIPPCTESGKELRDTIIWLLFIETCKKRRHGEQYVFISQNTKDFAAPDKTSLRQELAGDLAQNGLTALYYPSPEAFNKEHAERFEHINLEWVQARVNLDEIVNSVRERLKEDRSSYFRISDSDYRNYYEPRFVENIRHLNVEITDPVYIWDFDDRTIELSIGCSIDVKASVECGRINAPRSTTFYSDYYDDLDDDFPSTRVLNCYAELSADISATVSGDSLEFTNIEAIYPI